MCAYMIMHRMCAMLMKARKKKAREIVRSPETGVKDSCEPACEC